MRVTEILMLFRLCIIKWLNYAKSQFPRECGKSTLLKNRYCSLRVSEIPVPLVYKR